MGLAVKTDGAAVASGAITDALIRARALETGIAYEAGWILTTTTTVKVFIDVFIGIWALVLAVVWTYGIEKAGAEGAGARRSETIPGLCLRVFRPVPCPARPDAGPAGSGPAARGGHGPDRPLRGLFFAMTFFTIGMASDLKRLWAEGIGRLALVYVVSLFGFIIWIGLAISWLFFHGVHPPTIPGGP